MSDDKTPSAGDFVHSLGDALQAHPLPAALIGAGLVSLFAGRSSTQERGSAGQGQRSSGGNGSERARALFNLPGIPRGRTEKGRAKQVRVMMTRASPITQRTPDFLPPRGQTSLILCNDNR